MAGAAPTKLAGTDMLLVSAVALIDRDGRVLLAKRPESKPMAGLWEFPGGKVEEFETLPQALARELKEEVGIEINIQAAAENTFDTVVHDYPDKRVCLDFVLVNDFTGEPQGCEGQVGRWFDMSELTGVDFPDANKVIVDKLLVRF